PLYGDTRDLSSSPTRRSSDLGMTDAKQGLRLALCRPSGIAGVPRAFRGPAEFRPMAGGASGLAGSGDDRIEEQIAPEIDQRRILDRKSTRLNSSHVKISYAVF